MPLSLFVKHRFVRAAAQAALLAVLAACASAAPQAAAAPNLTPIRGCWIERDGAVTRMMRWFPDGPFWRGEWSEYRQGQSRPATGRYRVDESAQDWQVCGAREGRCWPLDTDLPTMADDPPVRATLAATETRLVFQVHDRDGLTVLFSGARDGCD